MKQSAEHIGFFEFQRNNGRSLSYVLLTFLQIQTGIGDYSSLGIVDECSIKWQDSPNNTDESCFSFENGHRIFQLLQLSHSKQ